MFERINHKRIIIIITFFCLEESEREPKRKGRSNVSLITQGSRLAIIRKQKLTGKNSSNRRLEDKDN